MTESKKIDWVAALRNYNKDKPHKSPAENDKEADLEFLKLLEDADEASENEGK